MHTLAPVAAAQAVDLISPARAAGWLSTEACLPGEFLCGAVKLYLGSLPIPVRLVVHDSNVEPLLEQLARDLQSSFYSESFTIMLGFSESQVAAFRARVRLPCRRLHVGVFEDYCTWLRLRLGPLSGLSGDSKFRQLLECFLSFSQAPTPAKPVPLMGTNEGSAIKPSFDLGDLGSQAAQTLMEYVHGAHHVENVEQDRCWRKKGVDLRVRGLAGGVAGPKIDFDVKCEAKDTGNLTLEDKSNLTLNSDGWLWTSKMSILASITWPTGELFWIDFLEVKEWVLSGRHNLALKRGSAPGQSYKSRIYLLPIDTLFDAFPQSACYLSLAAWMPHIYGGKFKSQSLVHERHASRKLVPQR